MNLERWLTSTRILRAPEGAASGTGEAAPAGGGAPAGDGATAPAAAAAGGDVPPAKQESQPSLLAAADAAKRDGAEATPAAGDKPATETPAKAGDDAPPPGGADGTKPADDAGDAKPKDGEGEGKKPDASKPTDGKPEGAEAAAETKDGQGKPDGSTEPPPAPKFDAYKVPETLKLDDTKLAEFNTILGESEIAGKADHAAMQQLGQRLIDFYATEVDRIGKQIQQYQVDVWNRINETRIGELKADAKLGGNRIDTSLGNAKYILEQFGGSKDEQAKLMEELDAGGVSNSVRFVALLNRMHERYREPQPVPPTLPSPKQNSGPGQRNWYGKVDGATA